jgi:hypothetical protein
MKTYDVKVSATVRVEIEDEEAEKAEKFIRENSWDLVIRPLIREDSDTIEIDKVEGPIDDRPGVTINEYWETSISEARRSKK